MKKKLIGTAIVICVVIAFGCTAAFATGLGDLISGKKKGSVTISQEEYDELIRISEKYSKLEEVYEYIDAYFYVEPD